MKQNSRGLLLNFGGKRGRVGTSISTEVFVPTGEIPPPLPVSGNTDNSQTLFVVVIVFAPGGEVSFFLPVPVMVLRKWGEISPPTAIGTSDRL